MLELMTLPAAFGMRNPSPFCLKMEMLLTSLELPFKTTTIVDPRKAPKGKLPYLVADGQRIADSELISLYLDDRTQGRVFAGLSAQQKAQGWALTRLAEDHLYWLMVAARWLDDDWYPHVVNGFFGFLPGIVRGFARGGARRQVAKTLDLQGLGRHSLKEQQDFARRDLEALDAVLPADGFLFGDAPGIFDFTVASMVASLADNEPPTWLTDIAGAFPDALRYAERVQTSVGVFAGR